MQFLKVEEEAGNPVERMANMLPRIVAADYQPLPASVRGFNPLDMHHDAASSLWYKLRCCHLQTRILEHRQSMGATVRSSAGLVVAPACPGC